MSEILEFELYLLFGEFCRVDIIVCAGPGQVRVGVQAFAYVDQPVGAVAVDLQMRGKIYLPFDTQVTQYIFCYEDIQVDQPVPALEIYRVEERAVLFKMFCPVVIYFNALPVLVLPADFVVYLDFVQGLPEMPFCAARFFCCRSAESVSSG